MVVTSELQVPPIVPLYWKEGVTVLDRGTLPEISVTTPWHPVLGIVPYTPPQLGCEEIPFVELPLQLTPLSVQPQLPQLPFWIPPK